MMRKTYEEKKGEKETSLRHPSRLLNFGIASTSGDIPET